MINVNSVRFKAKPIHIQDLNFRDESPAQLAGPQSKQNAQTRQNFYQKSFYNNLASHINNQGNKQPMQLVHNYRSPQNKGIKQPNFNSTIGFGQFQSLNASPSMARSGINNMSTNISPGNGKPQNFKNVNLKFAQGTYTQKFMQGRNSDAALQGQNVQHNSIVNQSSAKKIPYQMKLNGNLQKNTLMIDANSTFINFDRSKSGIGGAIDSSSIVGGIGGANYANGPNNNSQLNIFNSTLHKNARGRNFNSKLQQPQGQYTIGINQLVDLPKANGQGGSVMRNKYNLSPISTGIGVVQPKQFKDSYLSPKVQPQHQLQDNNKTMNISGSTLKIPNITMHNQQFIQIGGQRQQKSHYKSPQNHARDESPASLNQGFLPMGALNPQAQAQQQQMNRTKFVSDNNRYKVQGKQAGRMDGSQLQTQQTLEIKDAIAQNTSKLQTKFPKMSLPRAQPPPGAVGASSAEKSPVSNGQQSPEKPKLIVNNEYEREELIGGGSFGYVYKCKNVQTGQYYAIKYFKNKFATMKKAFDQREIQILQRFNKIDKRGPGTHCPFVMKAERIEYENRKLFIVFEQMDMSLTQYIKRKVKAGQKLDEQTEVKILMKQILTGMQYLNEECGILHRDLKPDNIMVNLNPLVAKIIDFGTCKDLSVESGPHTSYVSTRWYRAPECILRSHHYNFNSDIFATGCVMAELYLGHPLFPGSSELDQIDKVFQILGTPKKDQWREGYRLAEKRKIEFNEYPKRNLQKYLPGIGEEALAAIKFMLKISSQKRGSASDVLGMTFFKNANLITPSTQIGSNMTLNSPISIKTFEMDQNSKSIQKRNKSQIQQNIQISPREHHQHHGSFGSGDFIDIPENSNLSSFSNTLQQVNEVIQEQASEAQLDISDNQKRTQANNLKMPNIMIDQIDPKMLDTIVSTIQNKKVPNAGAEQSSGSFQPIVQTSKQNEMLIVINEQDQLQQQQTQAVTLDPITQQNSNNSMQSTFTNMNNKQQAKGKATIQQQKTGQQLPNIQKQGLYSVDETTSQLNETTEGAEQNKKLPF